LFYEHAPYDYCNSFLFNLQFVVGATGGGNRMAAMHLPYPCGRQNAAGHERE
jgi:hypothetical protein